MRRVSALVAALTVLAVGGCGHDSGSASGRTVVATTTQVADLVRQVGANRVSVDGMLRPNADPHEYEPRPSDVADVARADLVFRSGGDVDDWLGGVISGAGGDAEVVTLIDSVHRQGDDPHWWQDPRIAACVARVPRANRKIVTTHDALGYFASRYGIDVIGAVIPSLSTQAQASAGDTARLVDTIRREGVRAIFAESSVNAKVEQAIARETGARVGARLWADTLGPAGSDGATYLGSIAANTRAIADGLSGGTVHCRLPS